MKKVTALVLLVLTVVVGVQAMALAGDKPGYGWHVALPED